MLDDGADSAPLTVSAVSFVVLTKHLYIHVPFCARRCVYCDFSIAVRSTVPVDEYLASIEREWMIRHAASDFVLDTLYVGGGTPSKLGGAGLARLIDLVRRRATLSPDAEVSIEANPEDVSPETVRAWTSAGINRVSLGVQSFDDAVLAWMHRTHESSVARRAIDTIREGGVDNVSIDLIFATPQALQRAWERDLEIALSLALPHLSVYGLTVEPHTPLGRWVARLDVSESPEDSFEREFLRAHELLASEGFDHYEVSNYGKPGFHSRHNWAYWERRAYGGLGPSAHEFDGTARRWNLGPYAHWAARVAQSEDPKEGGEMLDAEQSAAESVYLSLRTARGLPFSADDRWRVDSWIDAGWATLSDANVRLTPLGWLRLDSLANDLTLLRSY